MGLIPELFGEAFEVDGCHVDTVLPADGPESYEARHAPKGGVTIGGKRYPGGEFIPGDVVAKATPEERAELEGKGGGTGRATRKGKAPGPRPKHLAAAGRLVDVARRRRVIHAVKNEADLAAAIGGVNLPDSEPADVVHAYDAAGKPVTDLDALKKLMRAREAAIKELKKKGLSDERRKVLTEFLAAQQLHFFEVKTLLTSAAGSVRMSRRAIGRKDRWGDRYGAVFHTVVFDDRKGSKHSGHRVYVAPGEYGGTTHIDKVRKAGTLKDVLDLAYGGAS